MPVTKEQLTQYVAELGLSQEQTDTMIATLLASDKAAAAFVGQRLRHDDYTRKTQELSTHKQQLESEATTQVTQYATELANAQRRIDTIMADLEKEQITAAQANARLRTVKERFNLSDDDIPAVTGVTRPAGTAPNADKGGAIDIDAKLNTFRADLMKSIRQDLMAMPEITAIQADIAAEHMELTGKRLTRKDMSELLTDAQKNKMRLEDAWANKYEIGKLRESKSDESKKKQWRDEWEAENKRRASEDALAGVRRVDSTQSTAVSPVLGRKFQENSDPVARPAATDKSAPTNTPPAQSGPKLSGAERAAARFLERRSQGLPMGAPIQQ